MQSVRSESLMGLCHGLNRLSISHHDHIMAVTDVATLKEKHGPRSAYISRGHLLLIVHTGQFGVAPQAGNPHIDSANAVCIEVQTCCHHPVAEVAICG